MSFLSCHACATRRARCSSNKLSNVINNGLFIGHVMRYRRGEDVICCPPPLYHAFGLVLGLLACYTHGVTIVYPSWNFEPAAVLRAVIGEKCTGLLGVPTMLSATLQQYRQEKKVLGPIQLRTGIAAGSPVPRYLMEELQEAFGLPELVIIYGKLFAVPHATSLILESHPKNSCMSFFWDISLNSPLSQE